MPVLEPTERASHSLASCCVLSIKPLATNLLPASRSLDVKDVTEEGPDIWRTQNCSSSSRQTRRRVSSEAEITSSDVMGSYKSVQILSMFGKNGPQQRKMTSINS